MAHNEGSGGWTWFLAGAAVGSAIALLYAPKSGSETRDMLMKKTEEGKEALSDSSGDLMDKGRELYDRGRQIAEDAADLFERGRKLVRGES